MTTNYSSIFSLFSTSVKDYNLDKLYNTSIVNFEIYLTNFLIKAIPNFINCKKNLEDRNDTTRIFNVVLNTDERVILSNLMLVEWLTKEVNDITQMSIHLQDTYFKTYSEAQNLKEKREHLNKTREDCNKQINQYGFKNLDWSTL